MEYLEKTPLGNLMYVRTLLDVFGQLPLTIEYTNQYGDTVLVEWVNLDDDKYDVYFMYKIEMETLSKFFRKDINHLTLIKSAIDDKYYEFKPGKSKSKFISLNYGGLRHDGLPKPESFYDKDYWL